jgi:hypothetical protein
MTSVTSASETQKQKQKWDEERALVARQLNLAKGRQSQTIQKLKAQGFEVLPVRTDQNPLGKEDDSPIHTIPVIRDVVEEAPSTWHLVRNLGLAIGSALITNMVVDYCYPRLRDYLLPVSTETVEPHREDMWGNQSFLK